MGTEPDRTKMNANLSRVATSYRKALRGHLDGGEEPHMLAARDVGIEAVAMGLETLDMAQIHEAALASLLPECPPNQREEMTVRAAAFFAEANKIIEDTHDAALTSDAQLTLLNRTLDQSTLDLEQSHLELREGIAERKTAEATLLTSEQHYAQLLTEARQLEEHLKDVSRKILAANEDERKRMSLQLQDEIAQTLLGIHVRLNALKKEVAANHAGITEEIAIAQRLVEASMQTIQSFAIEFGIPHES